MKFTCGTFYDKIYTFWPEYYMHYECYLVIHKHSTHKDDKANNSCANFFCAFF